MSKCECKECLHESVCRIRTYPSQYGLTGDGCDHFKAKSLSVELPVQVGQKVWYIKGGYYNSKHKHPREIEVTEINQKWHGKILDWGFIANGTRYRFSSIGKTVFLSREEAEKKLQEMG